MKNFSFGMLYYETKLFEQNCYYIITTKQMAVKNLLWKMKRPSSTKEMKEIGILRCLRHFSRM